MQYNECMEMVNKWYKDINSISVSLDILEAYEKIWETFSLHFLRMKNDFLMVLFPFVYKFSITIVAGKRETMMTSDQNIFLSLSTTMTHLSHASSKTCINIQFIARYISQDLYFWIVVRGCEFFWCKMFVKSLFTFIYAVHWNLKFSEISEILLRYEFLFECQAGTIYGNRTANVT